VHLRKRSRPNRSMHPAHNDAGSSAACGAQASRKE
jgi:hypothetical protein